MFFARSFHRLLLVVVCLDHWKQNIGNTSYTPISLSASTVPPDRASWLHRPLTRPLWRLCAAAFGRSRWMLPFGWMVPSRVQGRVGPYILFPLILFLLLIPFQSTNQRRFRRSFLTIGILVPHSAGSIKPIVSASCLLLIPSRDRIQTALRTKGQPSSLSWRPSSFSGSIRSCEYCLALEVSGRYRDPAGSSLETRNQKP